MAVAIPGMSWWFEECWPRRFPALVTYPAALWSLACRPHTVWGKRIWVQVDVVAFRTEVRLWTGRDPHYFRRHKQVTQQTHALTPSKWWRHPWNPFRAFYCHPPQWLAWKMTLSPRRRHLCRRQKQDYPPLQPAFSRMILQSFLLKHLYIDTIDK